MKKAFFFYLSFYILLFNGLNLKAQNEIGNPFVTNYKVSDYKAHSQNWGIAQDSRGFMYFGNGEGVLIYDGNNWKTFPIEGKKSVRSIKIDSNGIVYVGADTEFGLLKPTPNGSLNYISLSDEFEHLNFREIWDIHFIHDKIYFRSRSHIFEYYEGKIKYWETETIYQRAFVFNNEFYVIEDKTGLLILRNGNFIEAPLSKKFLNRGFYFLQELKNSVILANQNDGLIEYNPSPSNPEFRIINGEFSNALKKAGVYTGTITDKGEIIIGTWTDGLVIGNLNGELISRITIEQGILTNDVLFTYIDNSKNLWLGLNNGISRCDISFPISNWNSFNGLEGLVKCIQMHKGKLYIGTLYGLYYFENNKIKKFPENTRETWSFVNFTTPELDDTILMVATSLGVFQFKNNELIPVLTNTEVVYEIYQSKRNPNIIYFGSKTNVGVIEYNNDKFNYLGKIENTNNNIRGLLEDNKGNLWVSANRNGVVKISLSNNPLEPKEIKLYGLESELPSLKTVKAYNFKNRIVFGTEFGLYRFDYENERFLKETEIDVNFFNEERDIVSFIEDEKGIVYVSEQKNRSGSMGIAYPNPDGSYTWTNAVLNRIPEMQVSCFYKEKDILWIGGTEGLFKCKLNTVEENKTETPVYIRKVYISNDSTLFNGNFYSEKDGLIQIEDSQNELFKYEIEYEYRTIGFEFTSPNYADKEHLSYQYMLKGHDKNWQQWVQQNSKEYSNLLEGTYTFQVRSNNSLNYIADFTFTIKPPYYRTILAYVIYVVFAVVIFYLIIRFSNRQLKQRNEALEILVKKRTYEIEQQNEEILAQSDSLEKQNKELERLSVIARETDNAIAITDSKGTIEWVNEGFTRLYGYTFEGLQKNNFKTLHDFSISSNIGKTINDCINNKESKTYESLNHSKTGNNIWSQTTITPILDEDENVIKLIIIDSDISKLKLAEMEIIQQKDEIKAQRDFANQQRQFIEQQNKELEKHRNKLELLVKERTIDLEAAKNRAEESDRLKSAFLANMSHEIRTPMNAIIGFTSLLEDPSLPNENKQELITHIVHNSDTLLRLIDDIIDIAKIEAGQLEINKKNTKINFIFEEIFEASLEKRSSLKKDNLDIIFKPGIKNKDFTVYTDPLRLQQILNNLLDNALKFTEKGQIEVGYNIEDKIENPLLVFYVKDSGIGLSKGQQEQIFKRFTKFENDKKKLYRGAGLGLAICKNISNLLGGDIWVESEEKNGTTFYFNIPFIQKTEKEIRMEKQLDDEVELNWHNKTILIAEDEESNYRFLEMAFLKTNANLLRASDGKETIEIFQKNNVDLILMDIKLPGMDGLEATRRIRQIDNDIPIIAQTAFAMENDEKISIEAGCNDYISKPVKKEKLLKLISNYLNA